MEEGVAERKDKTVKHERRRKDIRECYSTLNVSVELGEVACLEQELGHNISSHNYADF